MRPGFANATFVSIFSGCGGFDLGFQQEGFTCVGAYDCDETALTNHAKNLGSYAVAADLSAGIVPQDLRGVDVMLAGPPCQGFSIAGCRRIDDPRNHLLIAAGRIVVRVRPRVCLIENVPGVAAGKHGQFWNELRDLLTRAKYQTQVLTCRAHTLGVAQIRTRLVLLAWQGRTSNVIDLPNHRVRSLRSALANVDLAPNHNPEFLDRNTTVGAIAAKIQPGQKLSNVRGGVRAVHTWDLPDLFGETTPAQREVLEAFLKLRRRKRRRDTGDADPVSRSTLAIYLDRDVDADLNSLLETGYVRKVKGSYDLANTFNGKYRRLKWDEPSLAVDTRFGNPRYFLHPEEHRGFTVREAARIQGFPDSFVFSGGTTAQFRMIGNAVPPPVAAILARTVRNTFFK